MTTTLQSFEAERAVQAQAQAKVNALFGAYGGDQAHTEIVRLATEEHAGFIQYDGYWAGPEWVLGKASVRIAGKGGVLAEPEDIVLMRRDYADSFLFFSVRTGWNCSVNYGLTPLMGWANAFSLWMDMSLARSAADHRRQIAAQYGPEAAGDLAEIQSRTLSERCLAEVEARLEHPASR